MLEWPDRSYFAELIRPWKVVTFLAAMTALLAGALTLEICDWDVGVTLLLGSLTYVCAPWCVAMMHAAIRRPLHAWPGGVAALALTWLVVDGAYVAYHTAVGNTMLREANLFASTPIYLFAGVAWLPRLSLREILCALASATARGSR